MGPLGTSAGAWSGAAPVVQLHCSGPHGTHGALLPSPTVAKVIPVGGPGTALGGGGAKVTSVLPWLPVSRGMGVRRAAKWRQPLQNCEPGIGLALQPSTAVPSSPNLISRALALAHTSLGTGQG